MTSYGLDKNNGLHSQRESTRIDVRDCCFYYSQLLSVYIITVIIPTSSSSFHRL